MKAGLEVRSPELIESVVNLIQSERRVTLQGLRAYLLGYHTELSMITLATGRSAAGESQRWLLQSTNGGWLEELSQQCISRYEKDGDEFLKKVVTCDKSWVWYYEPESKRQSMEWKHESSFSSMQDPITILSLEEGSTLNTGKYCELLSQVKKDIKNKRMGYQSKGVILPHDNARRHTAAQMVQTINKLGCELLSHSLYIPDLAPSDYHLFGPLKAFTRGQKFESDDEVENVVSDWLTHQCKDFNAEGIRKLVHKWEK